MEKGRGKLNGFDALNLGDGWALVSRADVGDHSCNTVNDSSWYTQGKTLEDMKEFAKARGYSGFAMKVQQGLHNYGAVWFKKCRH